jgi:four helix bundle protein
MATIKRFEDLVIWQKARKLSKDVYQKTLSGSFAKDFSLKDQINRATGSVMDNIAEGFGRNGKQEFIQFLSVAKSSATEVRSQLYRALDRSHISDEEFQQLYNDADTTENMTAGLMTYLKNSDVRGLKYKTKSEAEKAEGRNNKP